MTGPEFRRWLAKQADSLGNAISGLSEEGSVDGHAEANALWFLAARLKADAKLIEAGQL